MKFNFLRMGALTNKLYTFRSRTWELQSLDTIAINTSYFPLIKVNLTGRNIVRILPVVSKEEWIDDSIRFFKSEKLLESSLATLSNDPMTNIVNTSIKTHSLYHKNINLKETLTAIMLKIRKKITLSVIVGNKIDAKLIEIIRKFGNLKKTLKISTGFQSTRNTYINTDSAMTFEVDETLLALTNIKKVAPLLLSQIENFKESHGELYTSLVSEDIYKSYLGDTTGILSNIYQGNISLSDNPMFISTDSFTKVIPLSSKRLILDVPNIALYLNLPSRPEKYMDYTSYLNLNAKLQLNDSINDQRPIFFGSEFKFFDFDIFVNVLPFWYDKQVYFDLFGNIKKTNPVKIAENTSTKLLSIIIIFLSFVPKRLVLKDRSFANFFYKRWLQNSRNN